MNALDWLRSAPLSLGGAPVSWAEIFGDVTGVLCVWLLARQIIWTWPLGLANNVFWGILFADAKLYADSLLQGIFFALGCYGWWRWTWPGPRVGGELPVRRTTPREWLALALPTGAATVAIAAWLAWRTDSPAPLADASVLTLSLAATWGQANKLLESWWVWIGVDVISVPLYVSRELYPTAALYAVFGLLCVKGLRDWSRSLAATR